MAQWQQPKYDRIRQVNDFAGGLNNGSPAFSLAENESTEEYGFDTDFHPALKVHDGFALFGATGGAAMYLLTNYLYYNLVRAVGTKLQYYDITEEAWTDVVGTFEDKDWDSTNFNEKLLLLNESKLYSWSGSGVTDMSATSPAANYITNDGVRVWMAKGNTIYFSAYLDETDWTTTENSGFLEWNTDDGDPITAITCFNGRKIVFKNRHFAEIPGTDYYSFERNEISSSVGCVSFKTVKEASDSLFWLGHREVYMYRYGEPIPIGQKIRDYLDNINEDEFDKCWAGTDGIKYYLGLVTGTNTEPNITLVYDPRYNKWRVFDNSIQFRYSCNLNLSGFKSFYIGDADGNVYAMNDGATNNGTAISWSYVSKPFDEGVAEAEKEYYELHLQATIPVGSTMTVSVSPEPEGTSFTTVYTVTADDDLQNANIIIPLDTVDLANWFRYKLSGAGPTEIHSVVRYFRILPVQS